jgi:hypothetical protein
MIGLSHRPQPDNTQQSQQTNIHAPMGLKPTVSAVERPRTYGLDRSVTGTGRVNELEAIKRSYRNRIF